MEYFEASLQTNRSDEVRAIQTPPFFKLVAMEHSLGHSPDDKINVVIGNGDDHVGHIVWGVQVAFHGGPEETKQMDVMGRTWLGCKPQKCFCKVLFEV